MVRDSRMFDNRDASYVLSTAGMPERKLFSLLKVSCCHFGGNRSEWSPIAAACLVRREVLAWHLAWAFLPKTVPREFSSLSRGGCV